MADVLPLMLLASLVGALCGVGFATSRFKADRLAAVRFLLKRGRA